MQEKSEILFNSFEISARLDRLAAEILEEYASRGISKIAAICVAEGGSKFAADLLEKMSAKNPKTPSGQKLEISVRSIRASSYGQRLTSSGDVKIECDFDMSVLKGEKILLLDDILETGNTARAICNLILKAGAEEIKTCFLLLKNFSDIKKQEAVKNRLTADFFGFEIYDSFVFGYGTDMRGKFRELPDIWAVI